MFILAYQCSYIVQKKPDKRTKGTKNFYLLQAPIYLKMTTEDAWDTQKNKK